MRKPIKGPRSINFFIDRNNIRYLSAIECHNIKETTLVSTKLRYILQINLLKHEFISKSDLLKGSQSFFSEIRSSPYTWSTILSIVSYQHCCSTPIKQLKTRNATTSSNY